MTTENEMETNDLCSRSVGELARLIQCKDVSPVEVVEAYLRRIEARNPKLSAFLT